jgi:probable rRNA maturation factor
MINEENNIVIDVIIVDDRWNKFQEILDEDRLNMIMSAIIDKLNIREYINSLDMALVLAGDELVQQLNKEHRGQDKSTNVLSFPAEEIDKKHLDNLANLHFESIGDVVFSFDVMAREAEEQNKKFADHFIHLFVHGVLHIFGFDHIKDEDAQEMERLEVEILSKFSIPSPYDDPSEDLDKD